MDMQYQPPIQETTECNFLEDNFVACLKEKSVKDEVPKMTCNVEHLLWFNLECPDRFKEYKDPLKLRGIFSQVKKGKAVDRPAYVKL